MPLRMKKAAWAAAGIFTVGAVTGLTAPELLRTAAAPHAVAAAVSTAITGASVAPATTAP